MKKLLLSMLAMAAMVSCTNEIVDNGKEVGNGEPAEIRLSAGVLGVETKAVISDGATFTPSIVGWEGTGVPVDKTAPTWITETNAAIIAGTSVSMPFKEKQYYNPDGTTKTFIRAYHPKGIPTDGSVTFVNTNGDVDVMLTEVKDAGAKPISTPTATSLIFSHQLTQLQFKVVGDASLASGTTLTSIAFNATIPTGFNIITGALAGSEASFSIKNITANMSISSASENAGDLVMIKPFSSTTFNITVVTSAGTFSNVPVTLSETDANGGKSYTITLTFKQKEISATGTVTAWKAKDGAATVE